MLRRVGTAVVGALLLGLSACGGGRYSRAAWDGRRGYDGNGDYGYDLAQSRSEARDYRANAASTYPVPGSPDDPWGPYVSEAATRFRIPERWIRAVMQQESGGHLYASDGSLTTSDTGAMGLMQVMPSTYDMLRQHYGLGGDAYQPHDNILAGAAYIREMYDRFGAPGFLAAYNAGPDRLDAYLSGGTALPDETVAYLASVSPQLGSEVPMTGTLAAYAAPSAADQAYAGGGMTGSDYYGQTAPAPVVANPVIAADPVVSPEPMAAADPGRDVADRAFDGGGLVTATAPTGVVETPLAAPVSYRPVNADRPPAPAIMLTPVVAPGTPPEGWSIQVGAFADPAVSRAAVATARARVAVELRGAKDAITPVLRGPMLYRARLTGLSADAAVVACSSLERSGMACLTVPPGL